MSYDKGTKIRVNIRARINYDRQRSDLAATTEVTETDGGRWSHYLFLGSSSVKRTGDIVEAQFDAEVVSNSPNGPLGTTQVREIGSGAGFTHYLFLTSDCVTEITNAFETAGTITGKPVKERTTVIINRYSNSIDSSEVSERIEELENDQEYEVVRLRNEETLASFSDRDDAEQYIEDEDYNPERVIVRQNGLDDDDTRELSNLRYLRANLGEDDGWTIYNEDYFDSDWARDQAVGEGFTRSALDEWPFDLIDWRDAADQRRDYYYENTVTFDDQVFYYSD